MKARKISDWVVVRLDVVFDLDDVSTYNIRSAPRRRETASAHPRPNIRGEAGTRYIDVI